MPRSFLAVLVLLPLVSFLIGCDAGDGRLPIRGSVSLKGKPLEDGVIQFVSTGMKTGTMISKGKYEIPQDQGLIPGNYKVMITAGDGRTPAESPDGIPGPTGANIVSKELIPPEYNTNTKQEVTVKSSTQNKFDFNIP